MFPLPFVLAATLLGVTGCRPAPLGYVPSSTPARGTLIEVDPLGPVDRATLASHIDFLPTAVPVRYDVELFRVVYWTVDRGQPAKASGLLAIPIDRAAVKGVAVYLHGTNIPRATSPSMPARVDGNEESALFAGNGYYTVLPDYLGLGVSPGPQSYLILKAQVDATIDMLRAVRALAGQRRWPWVSRLFLMGFSQGGQTVAGVHRELERHPVAGLSLAGSVAVAGAYDLRGVTLPFALRQGGVERLAFMAFVVSSYAAYYGHPIQDALAKPYATTIPTLFDGSRLVPEIIAGLPSDARSLFRPAFLQALEQNETNWFTRALEENSAYDWVPKAPLRLYVGEADHNVSPEDSRTLLAHAVSRGGAVTLQSLGPVDHQESLTRAYPLTIRWFDSLAAGPGRSP